VRRRAGGGPAGEDVVACGVGCLDSEKKGTETTMKKMRTGEGELRADSVLGL
jgi:hypothetical protein